MLCECRRRTMLSLWLVLALPSPFVRAQSSINLVEESVERMPLIVSGAQGERSAILLVLPLERTSADGRRESADAVLIYEPTSQLGWWTYQHTSSTGDRRSTKFFLDDAVFHLTTEQELPVPMRFIGVQDRFGTSGDPAVLFKAFHLMPEDIVRAVKDVLQLKAKVG